MRFSISKMSKIRNLAILVTAFCVFWIYLGSLINFHQHHIFGRTLMSNGVISKREESITIDLGHAMALGFFSPAVLNSSDLRARPLPVTAVCLSDHLPTMVVISGLLTDHNLRAPPQFS